MNHPTQPQKAIPGRVESFHRALQAALQSRIALDLGRLDTPPPDHGAGSRSPAKIPSGRLTLRKLQALQALMLTPPPAPAGRSDPEGAAVDPDAVLRATFADLAADLPPKYVHGFSVYVVTGRTDLVLDAMSVDIRAERELSRVARPSLIYLAVLVFTGVLGSAALALMLLVVDDLRDDLIRVPRPQTVPAVVTPWLAESQFLALPWIALFVLLITSASLLNPVAAGIAKCLGGFGYLTSQRGAMAARVKHALLVSGIDGAAAEQTANGLVGFRPPSKRTPPAGPRRDPSASDLQRSLLEIKHFLAQSNTRLRQLRFGLPLLLVMTVGSAGVLLYSLALFIPLTSLLYDLSAPIVDPAMGADQR